MKIRLLGLLAAGALLPTMARAQAALTTEADLTVGRSSEGINVGAAQLRLFESFPADWRFYLEGAGSAITDSESDAFGAAYPYSHRARLMEAYVEKLARQNGRLLGLRAGRAERLDYDAGKRSEYLRRYTAGARVRVTSALSFQTNFITQPKSLDAPGFKALDFSLTCSARF